MAVNSFSIENYSGGFWGKPLLVLRSAVATSLTNKICVLQLIYIL